MYVFSCVCECVRATVHVYVKYLFKPQQSNSIFCTETQRSTSPDLSSDSDSILVLEDNNEGEHYREDDWEEEEEEVEEEKTDQITTVLIKSPLIKLKWGSVDIDSIKVKSRSSLAKDLKFIKEICWIHPEYLSLVLDAHLIYYSTTHSIRETFKMYKHILTTIVKMYRSYSCISYEEGIGYSPFYRVVLYRGKSYRNICVVCPDINVVEPCQYLDESYKHAFHTITAMWPGFVSMGAAEDRLWVKLSLYPINDDTSLHNPIQRGIVLSFEGPSAINEVQCMCTSSEE